MAASRYISISPLLGRLVEGAPATSDEIASALALIFDDRLSPVQCSSLLTLLRVSGRDRDSDVLAKCAARMRDSAAQIDGKALKAAVRRRGRKEGGYMGGICDIVGTGGDGHSTFNVSTTASIIASSLLLISKHGARASSSKSGSADLLQSIAPRAPIIEAITAETLPRLYEKGNYAFLFASTFHPGVRHVASIRKDLGFRTIFNILGPLASPVDRMIEARICGVMKRSLGPVYAEALKVSGARKVLVVCGSEELDEIRQATVLRRRKTHCWKLAERPNPDFRGPKTEEDEDYTTSDDDAPPRTLVEIVTFALEPADFGLPTHPLADVCPGQGPDENAEILMRMLRNELPEDDPTLHFVLMNAAALFVMSGICEADASNMGAGDNRVVLTEIGPGGGRWKEGVRRARWAIESGQALKALEQYIETTNNLVP